MVAPWEGPGGTIYSSPDLAGARAELAARLRASFERLATMPPEPPLRQ
jgi:hypothetical protein